MDRFKEKDIQGKPRWRADHSSLDKVAGWVSKDEPYPDSSHVNARPLSSLEDPAKFGPPPKRVTGISSSAGLPPPPPPRTTIRQQEEEEEQWRRQEEEEARTASRPYQMNTNGSNAVPLPLPPRRVTLSGGEDGGVRRAPPPIPPRLPPRNVTESPASSPTTAAGGLNTAALSRLGRAGISVPGFDINPPSSKGRSLPPPPPVSSRPGPSSLSIGELNVHLGKLSTSGAPAPVSPPKEGTTFAQKKAAIKTANAFYKDPTSISLADAKAAAATGKNIHDRHGDQVAAGYKKANELGITDKVGNYADQYARRQTGEDVRRRSTPSPISFGNLASGTRRTSLYLSKSRENIAIPSPPRSPSLPSPTLPQRPSQSPVPPRLPRRTSDLSGVSVAKKKPPPLPKRKPNLTASPTGTVPPLIPLATRPSDALFGCSLENNGYPHALLAAVPADLNLSLESLWFTKSPLRLPPAIERVEEKIYTYSTSWSRSAAGKTTHTLILSLRWTDNISGTKIRLTWDASAPDITVKSQQVHVPPPRPLDRVQLEIAAGRYGTRVLDWVRRQQGQQVGNGECWTLAHDALVALRNEDEHAGVENEEKTMVSQGVSHGACIFSLWPDFSHSGGSVDNLRPGDILQFRSARWVSKDAQGRIVREARAGMPEGQGCRDHTAVVESVMGTKVAVWEQNVGGRKTVGRGEYFFGEGEMVEGGVRGFRAVGEGWAGPVEAGWE
ncbi:hypothetical protein RUND412_003093 [Rhizina undulata]